MNNSDHFNEDTNDRSGLQIYWRFDEGKGDRVEDLTENEVHLYLEGSEEQIEDTWLALEDGDPMELEDQWGKK